MSVESWVAAGTALLIFCYLIYTLVRPEKF